MEKGIDQDLLIKFKAVAQGPEADLLREFVDMLYYRREESDSEPLSPEEQAALEEGREALRRGDKSYFTPWEEVKKEIGL
ncbi:MAG: hypothetical protein M0P73_13020 [Syntrophobacterales bacterium]|jgi:hypothetical protein|nr:hypothetical protein [Syntrophobacterales bacterium]